MVKWIFVFLVAVNLVFFAVMQWGGALLVDASSVAIQPPLNADKVTILNLAEGASSVAASHVPIVAQITQAQSSVVAAPVVAKAILVGKQSCMEWGEFSGAELQRAEKALATISLNEKPKHRQVDYVSGYWVYIAPMKTRVLVDQKIAHLKERGVADYFVIQEVGAWQNAISLGVFKTEDAAKKYLAKLQQQGVRTATIGERTSKLKYTVFLLSRLDAVIAGQIAALQKNFPESELKTVSCN
ncbi:MAG: hypothetical protein WCI39_04330 [Gallionellaceae bacterium]